jgi:hypothetical protein
MKESGGDVVVVVSTHEPGRAASFTLTIQTNDEGGGGDDSTTITPIPAMGEGMTVTPFEGVWHPDDAGRMGGPLDNPRLEFKTTDKTHLFAYVAAVVMGDGEELGGRRGRLGPLAVRLCLYHHKKKKTVRLSVPRTRTPSRTCTRHAALRLIRKCVAAAERSVLGHAAARDDASEADQGRRAPVGHRRHRASPTAACLLHHPPLQHRASPYLLTHHLPTLPLLARSHGGDTKACVRG